MNYEPHEHAGCKTEAIWGSSALHIPINMEASQGIWGAIIALHNEGLQMYGKIMTKYMSIHQRQHMAGTTGTSKYLLSLVSKCSN